MKSSIEHIEKLRTSIREVEKKQKSKYYFSDHPTATSSDNHY